MSGESLVPALVERISAMAELAENQLRTSLEAFVRRDAGRAQSVSLRDDQVDDTHHQLVAEMVTQMGESRARVADYVHLLFCVKNIERIADHAVNIAKAAHLKSTGQPMA
jgi:phosphate transport system protein